MLPVNTMLVSAHFVDTLLILLFHFFLFLFFSEAKYFIKLDSFIFPFFVGPWVGGDGVFKPSIYNYEQLAILETLILQHFQTSALFRALKYPCSKGSRKSLI